MNLGRYMNDAGMFSGWWFDCEEYRDELPGTLTIESAPEQGGGRVLVEVETPIGATLEEVRITFVRWCDSLEEVAAE